jgi:hypothetical protein
MVLHSFVYHVCVILILADIWDALSFPCKIGCDSSILCWILSIWEDLGCIFAFLAWFMHCQQGGEVGAWIGLLHAFRRFQSGFELFLSLGSFPGGICLTGEVHWSDRCSSQVLGDLAHWYDRWGRPVWPVRADLLQRLCFINWFACIRPVGVALVQGNFHVCKGSSLWFSSFGLAVCALCLSIVLSRMYRAVALA